MIQCCIMGKLVVDTTDEFYDTAEACKLLRIGYATLYRWIKASRIIPVRVGNRTLIPKSEVERITTVSTSVAAGSVTLSSPTE